MVSVFETYSVIKAAFQRTVARTAVYKVTLITHAPPMLPLVMIRSFLKINATAKNIITEW